MKILLEGLTDNLGPEGSGNTAVTILFICCVVGYIIYKYKENK